MKTVLSIAMLIVLSSTSVAGAAPYYRFWRGYKLDQISRPQFEGALNAAFISSTVRVGGGKGLMGYLPVLLPPTNSSFQVPDELALVIYTNEVEYTLLRNTTDGKAYADSHWQIFDRNKSKSLVPQPYIGKLESENAYDVFQTNFDWKQGHGIFITSKMTGDVRPYINLMRTDFSKKGLLSYVVLTQGPILYEYQLWKDEAALRANWAQLRHSAAKHSLVYSAQLSTQLKKQDWKRPQILPGLGLNILF